MRSLTAALVQMSARANEPDDNLARAVAWVDRAIDHGAELIVLPEGYAAFGDDDVRERFAAPPDAPAAGLALAPLVERTACGPTIVAGGVPEPAGDGRWFNTAFVLAGGAVVARYRKIHLFDFGKDLPGRPPRTESDYTAPGDEPVVADIGAAKLGLSICYDLRFPELYAALARAGADVLLVPAAFTLRTGLAHWEPLLRARAIETQCWVLAAAQHGVHGPGRESYGHSMIIDPWGVVVAQAGSGDGLVIAELTGEARSSAHAALPCGDHHRLPPGIEATLVDARADEADQ